MVSGGDFRYNDNGFGRDRTAGCTTRFLPWRSFDKDIRMAVTARMERETLKYKIHRDISQQILEGCEGRLGVKIHPRWFSAGNVYPDCSHLRLWHLHELQTAGPMVERMIRRFCRRGIGSSHTLSRWRSFRLGIISHYICDFSCFVHTAAFDGTLREHRAYEQTQGLLMGSQCFRGVCSFYGAEDAAELTRLLEWTLESRDVRTYSPADDLDYAASVSTEAAYTMLRICMQRRCSPATAWWGRLPGLRRLSRAS